MAQVAGAVIESLHVATGAAAGVLAGSRTAALVLGPLVHAVGDLLAHEDLDDRRFEIATGVGTVLLLAAARGALDPATLGGAAAAAPDLEHVLPLPRPGGRKLFPTHRRLHGAIGPRLPVWLQLALAGVILGGLAGAGRVARLR